MLVFGDYFLPRNIAEFSKKPPKANFQVTIRGSPEVISKMDTQPLNDGLVDHDKESNLFRCRSFDADGL